MLLPSALTSHTVTCPPVPRSEITEARPVVISVGGALVPTIVGPLVLDDVQCASEVSGSLQSLPDRTGPGNIAGMPPTRAGSDRRPCQLARALPGRTPLMAYER